MLTDGTAEIDGIAFDVNGTLVEILTEDGRDDVFRGLGHLLTYQGITVRWRPLRERYFALLKEQQRSSPEEHPEFDSVGIWRRIVEEGMTAFTRTLPEAKLAQLPVVLSEAYRGISRHRLRLAPHVLQMLDGLAGRVRLAVVTDAQSAWARAELHKVGILDRFDPVVVSGDHGYRKPDARLFRLALDGMGVEAGRSLYVGNDMYRDVFGAGRVGMRTVMYHSDQGSKHHPGCTPDHEITDFRQLLGIVGLGG
jgi:putative hydrolase of the HAD superfamily